MKRFLNEKQRKDLRFAHSVERERKYADRIKTVLLLDAGWTQQKICEVLLIDEKTIRRYRKLYEQGGVDRLCDDNYPGSTCRLNDQEQNLLKEHLRQNICSSACEIADYIKTTFKVNYTLSGVRDLLGRLGFVYKKTKIIPGKADKQKQQDFIKQLDGVIEAMGSCDKLYYMDGVHPQHNSQPAYAWVEKGQDAEIKTNTGRKRININGAVDSQSHQIFIREDQSLNAQSTLGLLKDLVQANPQACVIYVVVDNARYYRNKEVLNYVRGSPIELLFLPPYSPNLNLIERLWKFFKKKVLANRYYEAFDTFKAASLNFFEEINHNLYEKELRSLLTMNFQIIGS